MQSFESANKIDSSVPWLMPTLLSLFMLFKEYVNGIQLVETSRWLAQGDVKMRTDARLLREKIDDLTNVRSWETNFILNVTNMLFS
jgi:hypothetical protein